MPKISGYGQSEGDHPRHLRPLPDARNFPDGNPTANPSEERKQVYYIDRKSGSDDETVEFELSSPADLRGQLIPTRQIQPMCTGACVAGTKPVTAAPIQGKTAGSIKMATGWTILHRMFVPDCCQRAVNLDLERMNSWIMAGSPALHF